MRGLLVAAAFLCSTVTLAQGSEAIWPTPNWATSSPEEQGMDSAALAKALAFGTTRSFDSLLVVRHGRVVLHAPAAERRGTIPDLILEADEIERTRSLLEDLLAQDTGKTPQQVREDTERDLVRIWAGLLVHDDISVEASFFELGGHSLLATRVANTVQRQLGIELPIRSLFEHSDIRSIAQLIDAQRIRQQNFAMAMDRNGNVEMEW